MKRKSIGIAVMSLTLGVTGWFVFWQLRFGPTTFDAAAWRKGEDPQVGEDAPRLRMADGFVRSGMLSGKNRSEVESLLGPPTQTDKFGNYDLVYWLGPERGFISIDSEWLVVRFAKDDKVELAEIVRD